MTEGSAPRLDVQLAATTSDANGTTDIPSSSSGLHQRAGHSTGAASPGKGSCPDVEAPDEGGSEVVDKVVDDQEEGEQYAEVSWRDILKQFTILGWTAFGGPAAHIGIFQRRLVERLKWMSDDVFAELFALGQCMPGPTSTQVSFAMGVIKKGTRGGLLSGALFQYPGAIIMTAVGVGAAEYLANPVGWLNSFASGVSAVGVALVASAAKGMAGKLCAAPLTGVICAGAAIIAYYWPKPYTYPSVIAVGGLLTLGWSTYKKEPLPTLKAQDNSIKSHGLPMWAGALTLFTWLVVLIVTVVLAAQLPNPPQPLQWWSVFYRTGSIIYGGGQVVLPMLYTDVVQRTCPPEGGECVDNPDTWVTSKQFYAGLGLVQALPGPLFNFSAYLGAIMAINAGYVFIVGALIAWFGLFSPGILIIFGIMPFWGYFRRWGVYKRALPGFNAAGVGLIVASVFSLTFGALKDSDFPTTSLCIGIAAFTAVDLLKWFEPGVVIGGGVLGIIAWALGMM